MKKLLLVLVCLLAFPLNVAASSQQLVSSITLNQTNVVWTTPINFTEIYPKTAEVSHDGLVYPQTIIDCPTGGGILRLYETVDPASKVVVGKNWIQGVTTFVTPSDYVLPSDMLQSSQCHAYFYSTDAKGIFTVWGETWFTINPA